MANPVTPLAATEAAMMMTSKRHKPMSTGARTVFFVDCIVQNYRQDQRDSQHASADTRQNQANSSQAEPNQSPSAHKAQADCARRDGPLFAILAVEFDIECVVQEHTAEVEKKMSPQTGEETLRVFSPPSHQPARQLDQTVAVGHAAENQECAQAKTALSGFVDPRVQLPLGQSLQRHSYSATS